MSKYFEEITKNYYREIIKERTEEIKKDTLKKDLDESQEYMNFKLGYDNNYAISYKYLFKIINNYILVKVPFMPEYIHGVVNYRGEILSVLNLHYFFNEELIQDNNNEIIILNYKKHKLGLLVNKIKGFCRYDSEKLAAPFYSKSIKKNNFISQIYDNKTLILNIDEIFLDPSLGLFKNITG